MSTQMPQTAVEWIEFLMSVDDPHVAVELEAMARCFVRHPNDPGPRRYLENLLAAGVDAEFSLAAWFAVVGDERRGAA